MVPSCKNRYKDITSECTFKNCKRDGGSVFFDEKNKIVYLNLLITPTVTNAWTDIISLPEKYAPIDIGSNPAGTQITASVFWAYIINNTTIVRGAITSGSQIIVQGYYMLKDFMEA